MTHESLGSNLNNALAEIGRLEFIQENPTTYEIYEL